MASTILQAPILREIILPFILIFVLIFAILQKTKILGDDKKQIDSLVALAIALIAVSFGYATDIIAKITPFIAVAVVIILAFIILFGFARQDDKGFKMPDGLKIVFGIIIGVALVVVVLWATGALDYLIKNVFTGASGQSWTSNIIFIVVIIVVIVIALTSGKKSGSGGDKKED